MSENTISTVALIISIISFVWSLYIHHKSLIRNRRQATLDAFNVFQAQVLDELRLYTKGDITEIAKEPRSTKYKDLSTLLARCDHFAVGVNQEIYDMETVRRLGGEHIRVIFGKMQPLIQKKRCYMNDKKRYCEFEQLAVKLGYKADEAENSGGKTNG